MVGTVLTANRDTLDIPGPTFLAVNLAVAFMTVVGAVVSRIRVGVGNAPGGSTTPWGGPTTSVTGPTTVPGGVDQLHPWQAAYLNGEPRLAVHTTLGTSPGVGAIDVHDTELAATGPLPVDATLLNRAVHHTASNQLSTSGLKPRPRTRCGALPVTWTLPCLYFSASSPTAGARHSSTPSTPPSPAISPRSVRQPEPRQPCLPIFFRADRRVTSHTGSYAAIAWNQHCQQIATTALKLICPAEH